MFRMTAEHLYWWPVEVSQPSSDPTKAGEMEKTAFKLHLLALDKDEADALDAEIRALPVADRKAREHEHLERVVKGWADVEDDDGKPVPFSLDMFRRCMQRTWFRLAVYAAYIASLAGDEARTKN